MVISIDFSIDSFIYDIMKDAMPAITRTHHVLRAIASHPHGLGFTEIKSVLDNAPPATVSRLLKALVHEGLIEQRAGRYHQGNQLQALAQISLGQNAATLIQTACDRLAKTCKASALYCEPEADGTTMRAQIYHKCGRRHEPRHRP